MAPFFRRLEAVAFFDIAEQSGVGFFGDAHGAVALHVGMAANRRNTGAGAADIAFEQQQVHHLLDILRAGFVLGGAHAVADNGALGFHIQLGDFFDFFAAQA